MSTTGSSAGPRPAWRELDRAVQVLAPRGGDFSPFLEASLERHATPFSAARRDVVAALSAGFLADPLLRQDPASVAVGYWMRPAAVKRLEESFRKRSEAHTGVVRVPVGRVFHVAPSNVDTLFLYSWVLSYLCGNTNVVRISQERNVQVQALLTVLSSVAAGHPDLADTNRFVTYEHDAEITTALSWWCNHRILWGGDETIAALRPLALNPHASERVFGSKFSYAAISAARYLAADETERARVASAFFNDLFWFDQMACSSPHILFWVGDQDQATQAVASFETALQAEVDRKAYVASASDSVRRLNYAFGLAADADVRVHLEHPGFVGVEVRDVRRLDKQTCGGGLIRHARLEHLAELERFATEADQTLTHYGFESAELADLAVRVGGRGVDRLVPIGQALAFDTTWDGFDLVEDLVRKVVVRER